MKGHLKRSILFTIFWLILIFSVIAQVSDSLILWINPDAVSLWDERFWYTLVPVVFNNIFLFILFKDLETNKAAFVISFAVNTIVMLYYFYYQYIWDVGEWEFF